MSHAVDFSHEFPFHWKRYVELFFDPGLIGYLRIHLEMDEYRLEILERTAESNLRTLKVAPRLALPPLLRSLLRGKRIAYLETTSHLVGSKVLEWTVLASVLTEKIKIGGTYVLEDLGTERCRRTVLGEIQVDAYGVGGTIEERIAKSMFRGFDQGRDLMIVYDNQHPPITPRLPKTDG